MNWYLIIANLLTFFAFIVHTFIGDKELKLILPDYSSDSNFKKQETWTMVRSGWHWISFDLLMISIAMFVINFTNLIKHKSMVLYVIAIYLAGNAIFWIISVSISKSFPKNYLKLGQWMLLIVLSGLTFMATL